MADDVPFQIVTRSGNRNSSLTSDDVGQHPFQAAAPPDIPDKGQPCAFKNCHILGEHRYHCPISDCWVTIAHRHNRSVKRGSPPQTDTRCTALGCHVSGPHRYHCRRVDCQRTEAHRHDYKSDRRRKKLLVPTASTSNDQLQDSNTEDFDYTVDPNTETVDDHLQDLGLQDANSIIGPTTNEGPPIYHPQPRHPASTLLNHDNGIFDDASLRGAYSPGLISLDPVDDLNEDINFANYLASQQTTFNFNGINGITYPPIRLPLRESFYPFPETETYITDYDPSNPAASEYNPFPKIESYITNHDPSNPTASESNGFPFIPLSNMDDLQQYPFPENETCITDYDPSNPAASEYNPFPEIERYITDHDPSNPTASESNGFPFIPLSHMDDLQQDTSQNTLGEPCTAPTCPLTWPHLSGPYQHNIGLAEEHEVFGRSNPPVELWEALERVEKGDGSEEDFAAVGGFVEQHA